MMRYLIVAAVFLSACASHGQPAASYGSPSILLVETTASGSDLLDDSASIAANISALQPNQVLHFPAGIYHLDSEFLAAHPLFLPCSNISITGDGAETTRVVVTGTAVTPWIFAGVCNSNVSISGLSFTGNSAADSYGNGGALVFTNSHGQSGNIAVSDCQFRNFKGDYWIHVENVSGIQPIDHISVTRCKFYTEPGNSRMPTSITCPQGMVGIVAHNSSLTGGINDIRVDSNSVECVHSKGMLALFGNCDGISVCNNYIRGAGLGPEFSDDSACYAIMCYNNFMPPRHGTIGANRIIGARDNGMYLLQIEDFVVSGNTVTDQTSTSYETLPKAAIALNGAVRTVCSNNAISSVHTGIYFQGGCTSEESASIITGNSISGAVRSAITVESSVFPWHDLTISSNRVYSSAQGVFIAVTAPIYAIAIHDNDIRASSWGINAISSDPLYRLSGLSILGNSIYGNGPNMVSHVSIRHFQNCQSVICGNVFFGFSYVQTDLYGSTGITVSGNITP